eukprot:contig_649_g35
MTTDIALRTGVDGAVAGDVIPFEKNAAGLFKRLIQEESEGCRASDQLVRSLCRAAKCEAHPFGQELGGVMHARRRAYLPSERRSVTLFHALVDGKTTEMYCELFQYYFTAATQAGLRSPADEASTTAAPAAAHETAAVTSGLPQCGAQSSAVLLDFELAEHNGLLKALANVFWNITLRYHGRVVGGRVLGDVDDVVGVTPVMRKLHELYELYDGEERGGSNAKSLKWKLDNRPIVVAAFPFCSGQLSRDAIRATGQSTNAIESLNKQTQDVVAADGDRSLLGVIGSL